VPTVCEIVVSGRVDVRVEVTAGGGDGVGVVDVGVLLYCYVSRMLLNFC
jgi:hypothetical protein